MSLDDALAEIEARQFGVSTAPQLKLAGYSRKALRHRVDRRRVSKLPHGLFVNPAFPETFEQRTIIAVLGAGPTAFASHATAAHLWDLLPVEPALIEVTTILERQPRVAGARMHRSGLLVDNDIRRHGAIPLSSPERTIVDLSGRLNLECLGRLLDEALRRRVTTLSRVVSVARRLPRAPGRSPKRLAHVLDARIPGTESTLEDFVVDALKRYDLPLPEQQYRVVVNGRERRVDHCYPDHWLAIEALGYEYHGSRSRFDADALRGNELQLAGFRVLEFTSAFDDWTIASQVATALRLPAPNRLPSLTYREWSQLREA